MGSICYIAFLIHFSHNTFLCQMLFVVISSCGRGGVESLCLALNIGRQHLWGCTLFFWEAKWSCGWPSLGAWGGESRVEIVSASVKHQGLIRSKLSKGELHNLQCDFSECVFWLVPQTPSIHSNFATWTDQNDFPKFLLCLARQLPEFPFHHVHSFC